MITKVWLMGKNTERLYYMLRVGDEEQMFWQSRNSKLGRMLEKML